MRIGKTCPRFSEFGLLYPASKRVQRALCDYYAVVFRLCKHITLAARRPSNLLFYFVFFPFGRWFNVPDIQVIVHVRFSRTIIYPFEVEVGPFESRLEYLSKVVHEEISLASKQAQIEEQKLQAWERHEARSSRHMLAFFGDKALRQDEDAKRWRVARDRRRLENYRLRSLDALSTYDNQKIFKQFRRECVPGTSTWIYEDADFQSWVDGSVKNLWCTGRSK